MKSIGVIVVLLILISCDKNEVIEQITNPQDYQEFLFTSHNNTRTIALSEVEFWSKRLRPDSSGIGDLGPLANSYITLFETSGEISYLKNAEKLMKKAIAISAHNKDSYTRSLSNIYSTQHRFKEVDLDHRVHHRHGTTSFALDKMHRPPVKDRTNQPQSCPH